MYSIKYKNVLRLILSAILFASLILFLKSLTYGYYPDYSTYYYAVSAIQNNMNPYIQQKDMFAGYLYPPFSLLFFSLFHIFPFYLSQKIFTFFSLICFFSSIFILMRMYKIQLFSLLGMSIWILVLNYFPAKFTLGMGQINNVIFLLMVIAIHFLNNNHPKKAGILLGITLTLKYTPIFILPYLIIRKRWQTFFTTIITGVMLFLLGFILYPDISYYYLNHVLFHVGLSSTWTAYYNQALSGFLIRDFSFLTNVQLTIIRYVISLIILLISLYIVWKSKQTKKFLLLEVSIFITVNLLLNTFSEQHHFVFLLIPLIVTYFTIKVNKLRWHYYSILGISYLLTAMNLKNPSSIPALLQSHVFYGTVILWILELHLLQKLSKTYQISRKE